MVMGDMTASKDIVAATPINLPGRLDYAACGSLAAAIDGRRGNTLQLQAANVQFLGALAAEILVRARAEWLAEDLGFALVEPSKDFLQGLALLGIAQNELIRESSE